MKYRLPEASTVDYETSVAGRVQPGRMITQEDTDVPKLNGVRAMAAKGEATGLFAVGIVYGMTYTAVALDRRQYAEFLADAMALFESSEPGEDDA